MLQQPITHSPLAAATVLVVQLYSKPATAAYRSTMEGRVQQLDAEKRDMQQRLSAATHQREEERLASQLLRSEVERQTVRLVQAGNECLAAEIAAQLGESEQVAELEDELADKEEEWEQATQCDDADRQQSEQRVAE